MFLNEKDNFPPNQCDYWFLKYEEWASWYSGDPEQLLRFYTRLASGNETAQEKFWSRLETEERKGIVHMPLAGDIASTSADLLFSESPIFKYDQKTIAGERIKDIIEKNGFNSILLESAEISAAISGCVLKLDIEAQLEGVPLINVMNPKQFIPTFWRGRLWEILFFRVVKKTDSGKVFRLFENRRRSGNSLLIEYKLNVGTATKVGKEIDPNSIKETENLNLKPVEYKNMDGLGCVYVPNMRPNRLVLGSPLGINDYSDDISLLDSLDFAWTSWMRDIELGMAQIFVDEELLQKTRSDVNGTTTFINNFSKFQKSFVKMDFTQWRMSENNVKPIEQVQFEIRVEEHMKTCSELTWQIISNCGYSPQTFGLGEYGNAQSGTALKIRENKSQKTRSKKEKYFKPAIISLLQQAQNIDKASGLYSNYENQQISLEIEDSIMTDNKETSEVIRNLYQAKAISNFMKVKLQHPDWTDEKIQEEVDKINADEGITGEMIKTEV